MRTESEMERALRADKAAVRLIRAAERQGKIESVVVRYADGTVKRTYGWVGLGRLAKVAYAHGGGVAHMRSTPQFEADLGVVATWIDHIADGDWRTDQATPWELEAPAWQPRSYCTGCGGEWKFGHVCPEEGVTR